MPTPPRRFTTCTALLLLSLGCDRADQPSRNPSSGGVRVTASKDDPVESLQARLAYRAARADKDLPVGPTAAQRIRAVAAEINRHGVAKFAGQARMELAPLTKGDEPGSGKLLVQYLAATDFVPDAIEFLDANDAIVATAPAGRMEGRDVLGANIDSVLTVVYVVPSPYQENPTAAARLLAQQSTTVGTKTSVVKLEGPVQRLRVRVKSKAAAYSDTAPLVVIPAPAASGAPRPDQPPTVEGPVDPRNWYK